MLGNEMAPRVHNTAHWTIEGAETSQFENHLRAVCGLPLGSAAAVGVSAMVNLIGEMLDRAAVLAVPGARRNGAEPRVANTANVSFEGIDAEALLIALDLEGVAVRSGHHCAHPLMQFYGVPATCRASLAFYNTHAEIESFIVALLKVRRLLA